MLKFVDEAATYDHIRQDIQFTAVKNGTALNFRVSKAALLACGRLPSARPMQLINVFDAFRGAIELAAQKKYELASYRISSLAPEDFQIGPEDLALPSTVAAD